ncbi:MAG TPA: acyl-CoA dehydrogenase family protein [Blastocatellia bacterium]|nr:acyl-CoA dehydrogenase family protein [Blastocatellia bacterium]
MSTQLEKQAYPVMKGGSFLIEDHAPADVFTPEDFSEEHRMIAQTAEDFVFQEVVPMEPELEKKNWVVLVDLLRKAAALGLTSMDVPEEYGGLALDKVSSIIVSEKISASASFATTHGGHAGIGTLPIVYFGNAEQKAKYLPRLATAELPAAYCLTEPGSGSDALAARTKAVLNAEGTHYVLNGEKMWITNAGFAQVFIVFAKVDGQHFTGFIVERGFPGVSVAPEEHKMGLQASSTCAVRLNDAMVPVENVLGEIGKGHKIAFDILNIGRFKLGASSAGGAKYALRSATQYAKERKQFGVPIASFGLIQHKLAEIAIRTYAAESMVYRTAGMIDTLLGTIDKSDSTAVLQSIEEYAVECSTIKVWNSEMIDYVVDEEVQIFGGNGYSKDYPAEKHYRDARINRIFEGTSEINRLLISGMLLKRAMKGDIPLMPAVMKLMGEVMSLPQLEEESDGLLAAELRETANAKKVALLVAGAAAQKFGANIKEEQEVLALASNIIMQAYAMESAVLRALKLSVDGGDRAVVAAEMAQVFVYDSVPQVDTWAKAALAATLEGDDLRTMLAALRRFTKQTPVNTVALRRKIAARVIETERYPLT